MGNARRLVIPGRLPGLNDAFGAARRSRFAEAKMRNQSEATILWAARGCLRGWKAHGPVILQYTFYERDRRRDKDNVSGYACKVVQDALVKGRYLKNDGWGDIENSEFAWAVDKARPRIEVEILEVGET